MRDCPKAIIALPVFHGAGAHLDKMFTFYVLVVPAARVALPAHDVGFSTHDARGVRRHVDLVIRRLGSRAGQSLAHPLVDGVEVQRDEHAAAVWAFA